MYLAVRIAMARLWASGSSMVSDNDRLEFHNSFEQCAPLSGGATPTPRRVLFLFGGVHAQHILYSIRNLCMKIG